MTADGLLDYPREAVNCEKCGTTAMNPNFVQNSEVEQSESDSEFDSTVWINPVLFKFAEEEFAVDMFPGF